MSPKQAMTAGQWRSLVGTELGVSPWIAVEQPLIGAFARLTGDHQFIHVDPQRAQAESPFGATIAHGFLVLSLLSPMLGAALPRLEDAAVRVNYGFDRVRFLAPVRAGARVRGRFRLLAAEERRPAELTLKYGVTVEIEGAERPALAAEWLSRIRLEPRHA